MRLNVSRFIDGPSISDSLAGNQTGLDLSSFGLAGGAPGETSYFSLYINVKATETEKHLFDAIQNVGVYLIAIPTYSGDYLGEDDKWDIWQMGDAGYGLAIKDPVTGTYSHRFTSNWFVNPLNKYVFKKEHAFYFDRTDVENPIIINYYGIDNATASVSSTGRNLILTTPQFNPNHKDLPVFNTTDNTRAYITEYVSPTEVILDRTIGDTWDNDQITIKQLISPADGILSIKDEAEFYGNFYKLDFEFTVPPNYFRAGIKQFALVFHAGR